MALSLRFGSEPLDTTAPLRFDNTTVMDAANQDIADASQLRRGWVTAGYQNSVGELATASNDAALRGDGLRAAYLKQLAEDEAARAQAWAPTVQNFTDINGVGSALDWAGGALGNMRTSVAPAVGGLIGTGLGAAAGYALKNPALGAKIGGFLGASVPAYQMEKGESVAGAVLDPNNAATPEQIDRAGTVKGLINAGLEAAVPYGLSQSLAGLGKQVAKGEAKKYLAKELAKNAGEEFLTEGAQSLVGQGAENYLKGQDLTDFDYKQAFNEGMAGAVGGAGMGGIGAAGAIAHSQFGRGVDAAKDFAANPTEKIGNAIADLGDKAGEYFGNKKDATEKEVDRLSKLSDEELVAQLLPKRKASVADPLSDEDKALDDKSLLAKHAAMAKSEAEEILKAPSRTYTPEVVQAANDIVMGRGDGMKLASALRTQKDLDDSDDMLRAIEGAPKSKKSLMRPTLTDDRGEQEGRDMSQDFVTDNFGRVVRGTGPARGAELVSQKQKGIEGLTTGENIAPHLHGAGTDAVNASKTVSQTPYVGDSFGYGDGNSPSITSKDVSENNFNYDSIQRSAGVKAAQDANKSEMKKWEYRILDSIQRIRAQKSQAKTTEADAVKDRQTVKLADVMVNAGFAFGDKSVINAATSAAQKEEHTTRLAGLITWGRYGFQNQAEVIPATLKLYGKGAVDLVRTAYEAGVKEGIIKRDDAAFKKIEQEFVDQEMSDGQAKKALMANLKETLKPQVTKDNIGGLIKELRGVAERGATSAADRRILETLFGPAEEGRTISMGAAAALEPFGHKPKATQTLGDTGLTDAALEEGEQLDDADPRTVRDAESAYEAAPSKTEDHFNGDKGFFNLQDPEQKAAYAKLKKDKEGVDQTARVEGRELGIVDHALEQAATEKGGDLTEKQRFKVLQKLVHEHNPGTVKLAALPKHASQLTRQDHAKRKAEYERLIESKARALNKQHVALRLTTTEAEKPAFEFNKADLDDLKVNRDLRKAVNGVGRGTLVFERAGKDGRPLKDPFVTSAPLLLRKMYGRQDEEGFKHLKGEQAGGSAHTVHSLMMDGINSLILSGGFTGRVGYPGPDGEPVWLTSGQDFPENMVVMNGDISRKKPARTYGEAKRSAEELNATSEDVKDFDPADFGIRKKTLTPVAQMWAMLKNDDLKNDEDAPQLEKFLTALSDGKIPRWDVKRLIGEWSEHLGINGVATQLRDGDGKQETGQVGTDTLKDYDPKHFAPRNKYGMVDAKDVTMSAASLVGRTVDPSNAAKIKADPVRAKKESRTQDVAWDFPSDGEVHKQAVAEQEADEDLRMLNTQREGVTGRSEQEQVTEAIQSLPIVRAMIRAGFVDHIAIDNKLTGKTLGYMTTATPANSLPKSVVVLSPRLFGDLTHRLASILAHEVAHTLEGIVGLGKFREGGRLAALARKIDENSFLGKFLMMPLQKGSFDTKESSFAQELHAQLFAAYSHPLIRHELKQHQELFYRLDQLYGSQAKLFNILTGAGRRTGSNAAQRNQAPSGNTGLERGSSDQVRGETGEHRVPSGQELSGELPATVKERLIKRLSTAKPVSREHAAAIKNALAVLKGEKEGLTDAALSRVFAASEYLGKEPQRRTLNSGQQSEVAEDIPEYISDYEEEYGFDPEQAEMDSAMFEEGDPGYDEAALQRHQVDPDRFAGVEEEQVKEATPAEQLQSYLDQYADKNTVWARAARKALADNNEKQITGTLAHAKKQFGELNQSEPVAQPVSQSLRPAGTRDGEEVGKEFMVGNLRIQEGEAHTWINDKKVSTGFDDDASEINDAVFNAITSTNSVVERARRAGALNAGANDVSSYWSNRELLTSDIVEEDARAELKAMHVRQDLIDDLFDPRYADDAADTIVDQLGAFERDAAEANARQGKLFNKQQANSQKAPNTPQADQATQDKVNAFLHKVLGDKIKVEFVGAFIDKSSGEWEASDTGNVIRIALNGDVMGTGFHEAIHELFDMLRKHGGEKIIKQLEQAAMSPLMQKRLERMLDGHPEAIKQLAQPEEAVAFMFQFWMMDPSGFQIGPQTKTFFQKVKDFIAKVAGLFSESVRNDLIKRTAQDKDAVMTDALLSMFAEGALGAADSRQAVIDKLNSHVEKHEAAMRHIGDGVTKLWDVLDSKAGRLVMTAEGVIEATNNPHWNDLSLDFHQKAGTAMRKGHFRGRGGFAEAVRQEENTRMAHLERLFQGADKADLELARKHLSEGTKPDAKEARRLYDGIRAYLDDFQKYISERKVTRLERNEASGEYEWVPVQFRQDYWPQAFDVDALLKNTEQFKADLLQHHRKQLEAIAKEANAAVKAKIADGPASKAVLEAAVTTEITPERIAEEILSRVVNRNQLIDISETDSQLGITPAAAAVNRRTLDWLDMSVFDKYMDKDVVNILSGYTASMVKRAESQSRFGAGGHRVQDMMDKGLLYEMGGQSLVDATEDVIAKKVLSWNERAAAYYAQQGDKRGEERIPYSQVEPMPTLRSVGTKLHEAAVGQEQYKADLMAAVKKAEGVEKAVMGMEGTLGRDISPNKRALNSWITTYQNFRTLSLSLFQSFSDVMGVVREGGEFSDAWDAFVMGMREVRNTWKKELSDDPRFLRAEDWGAVDAGASMESYGSMSNSIFMTGKAKQLSDSFFRWNGMEGWNRGTRALAANVAERIITKWAEHGIDSNDKAAVARFERLFGEGAKTSQIKLDANGRLDINDLDNRAAVNRWVLDAIATPNGAIKALYANDPNYSIFYALKNFSYAMHRVALKGAVAQARLGNYRPAAILATGYIPIIIAANAVKEMLIPGDEPPWMQKGLGGWLGYGWDRAGLLGVPQMYAQNLFDADPAAAFGPTVDQLQNILSIPFPEIKVDLPGFDPMTLHRDHTLLGEGFGSLPFGSVLRRIEKLAA